jgi:hypothetical protein
MTHRGSKDEALAAPETVVTEDALRLRQSEE